MWLGGMTSSFSTDREILTESRIFNEGEGGGVI